MVRRILRTLVLVVLAVICTFTATAQLPDLVLLSDDGFSSDCLFQGRTAATFVVFPDCDACIEVTNWLYRAAEAFPEIQFFLVSPENATEFADTHQATVNALADPGGAFGATFHIQHVPATLLFINGANIARLDWSFTEGELLRALAESLLVDFRVPEIKDLRGERPSDFTAVDLQGSPVSLSTMQPPYVISFLSLECSPCWEALEPLAEISMELPVALVSIPGSQSDLSEENSQRLASFESTCPQHAVQIFVPSTLDVLKDYHLVTSPTFFLVDGDGLIAEMWSGREVIPQLLKSVQSVLESMQ